MTSSSEAPIQVTHHDENTVILRQSKAVHYEAPFLYLLFGEERALLLDTGATEDPAVFPLRETVDGLIIAWLSTHPRDGYELVVAHSHGHGDHVAADAQFADRPATVVVARELDAVKEFFGFGEAWPAETVTFDLGGRVLTVLGAPGHHRASITIFDPWTGFLLTGDTVLPGRLYVEDTDAYRATIERLVAFADREPVTSVRGCHVEMKRRPGADYPLGAVSQPDERPLPLTPEHLVELRDALVTIGDRRGVFRYDDFIVYNRPPTRDLLRLVARARVHKAVRAVRASRAVRALTRG